MMIYFPVNGGKEEMIEVGQDLTPHLNAGKKYFPKIYRPRMLADNRLLFLSLDSSSLYITGSDGKNIRQIPMPSAGEMSSLQLIP